MGRQTRAPITERKTRLDGSVVEYLCERIAVEPGRHAIVRYVTDRDRTLEGSDLVLRTGTVTIGHFWVDRPYNVYHWLERERTIAFYVNIATDNPVIGTRSFGAQPFKVALHAAAAVAGLQESGIACPSRSASRRMNIGEDRWPDDGRQRR